MALDKFSENSFALVQKGYLLSNTKYLTAKEDKINIEQNSNKQNPTNTFNEAKKKFKDVIKLIDEKNQFNTIKYFQYKIKFEALLGLAYLDYQQGLGTNAEKKYQYAEKIINDHLSEDKNTKDYLLSILKINMGRNILDNKINSSMIA